MKQWLLMQSTVRQKKYLILHHIAKKYHSRCISSILLIIYHQNIHLIQGGDAQLAWRWRKSTYKCLENSLFVCGWMICSFVFVLQHLLLSEDVHDHELFATAFLCSKIIFKCFFDANLSVIIPIKIMLVHSV